MSSETYKNISSLIKTLSEGIKKLEKGDLKPDQITLLLEDARSLHERLALFQYMSYEKELEENKIKSKKVIKGQEEKNQDKTIQLNFGSNEEVESKDKQINLLDAIDEEIVKTDSKDKEASSENEQKNFSSSGSVNEKFAQKTSQLSIADRLGKQPISDLSKAIGINEKFLFINDLFKGENTDYNSVIKELNAFNSFEEAQNHIQTVLQPKYQWKLKNSSEKKFIKFIERRYL